MKKFATILTITTLAYGLAFDGPLPTPVQDLVNVALDGWTPRPTNQARSLPDLFRRQKANSAVCGYLDGDADYPVSCPSGSCNFNTASKWFGCCTSSSCPIVTRCVNSASASSCLDDASCYNDPLAMACTASSAPYCVNMFAKVPDGTMSHWVCGAAATSVAVLASATSASAGQTSVAKMAQSSKSGDASAAKQGAAVSTAASGSNAATPVANSVKSTGGASLPTAHVMLGAAGGLVGVFALFL